MKKIRLCIFWLLISLLLGACAPPRNIDRKEIENLPGAYAYSKGTSPFAEQFRQASGLLSEEEFKQAEEIYRQLIDLEPLNPDGYIGLGTSLLLQNRLEEALRNYQRAHQLAPESTEALIGMGSTSFRMEAYDQAQDFYAQALEIDPTSADACWGMAISLEALGHEDEMVGYLEQIIQRAPGSSLAIQAQEKLQSIISKD